MVHPSHAGIGLLVAGLLGCSACGTGRTATTPRPAPASAQNVQEEAPATPQQLLDAIAAGQTGSVRAALAQHPDWLRQPELFSIPPLHVACSSGHLDLVELLVESGADVDEPYQQRWTPLHAALTEGRGDIVRFLLDAGAKTTPDIGNPSTLLNLSAARGDLELTRLLIERGASPRTTFTPVLYSAAASGNRALVEYLIARGCDPRETTDGGASALHAAAAGGHHDLALWLLDAQGLDIHGVGRRAGTVAHAAARGGDLALVKRAVEAGAVASGGNELGQTALHFAAMGGDVAVIEYLLAHGCEPHRRDKNGYTPLFCAASEGRLAAVQAFVAHGAAIDERDPSGQPVLHVAAWGPESEDEAGTERAERKIAVARWLIEHGADVNGVSYNRFTPLYEACISGAPRMARMLIDLGADVHATNDYCYSLIHTAAYSDCPRLLDLLIAEGLDVNLRAPARKTTPLHCAVHEGSAAMIEALIARGAEVNAVDADGNTPLHWCRDSDKATALILHGGNLLLRNAQGQTPLDLNNPVLLIFNGGRSGAYAKWLYDEGLKLKTLPPPRS